MLAARCGSMRDGFDLAAEFRPRDSFITVGRMTAPLHRIFGRRTRPANGAAALDAKILTYSLALNASSSCILASAGIERALQACFLARLVSEWRIAIPGVGVLQAPFIAAQHSSRLRNAWGAFDLTLRLAGKPEILAC